MRRKGVKQSTNQVDDCQVKSCAEPFPSVFEGGFSFSRAVSLFRERFLFFETGFILSLQTVSESGFILLHERFPRAVLFSSTTVHNPLSRHAVFIVSSFPTLFSTSTRCSTEVKECSMSVCNVRGLLPCLCYPCFSSFLLH